MDLAFDIKSNRRFHGNSLPPQDSIQHKLSHFSKSFDHESKIPFNNWGCGHFFLRAGPVSIG